MTGKLKMLVIGCGNRPIKSNSVLTVVNLDMAELPDVDVVHDLDVQPYPFEDGTFDQVRAEDVLEHVNDIVKVMAEVWRVMKVGGTLWIRGPHANYPEQAWRDPTHKRLFVPGTFDNWDPEKRDGKLYGYYFLPAKFSVLEEREHNKGMEYLLKKMV